MQRRHLTNRFIYMGDPRAIIQSVAEPGADGQIADDSLDMLSPETGVDSSAVDEGGMDSSVISDGVVSQGGTTPGVGTGPLKVKMNFFKHSCYTTRYCSVSYHHVLYLA